MKNSCIIAQAILWAAATLSAALLRAPAMLSLVLLPTLGSCAILLLAPRAPRTSCRT